MKVAIVANLRLRKSITVIAHIVTGILDIFQPITALKSLEKQHISLA